MVLAASAAAGLVCVQHVWAGSGTVKPTVTYASYGSAASELTGALSTGSLIVSKGDCLAVKVFTKSPYTHVAIVVCDGVDRWVYDSMNGVGVRKLSLEEYLSTQAPDQIHLFHPKRKITGNRQAEFVGYLNEQIGRPYAIKHHLTGNRGDGIHCAEYVTDALMCIDVIQAKQPSRVSPASLVEGVTKYNLYSTGQTVQLKLPEPIVPKGDNACDQMWIDTKICWNNCCRKMRGWFLCQ